jgi:ABC-type multidrug transport system fused ATPase/permease subunit
VIAHRLSTVEKCDKIVVMKKGKIVEEGKYHDLLKRRGYFYNLVNAGK